MELNLDPCHLNTHTHTRSYTIHKKPKSSNKWCTRVRKKPLGVSLHFPLHTHSNTHTLSGSFLQKSAHWTNPLALAAGRERNRGEPRFQDRNFPLFFHPHLSKHLPLTLRSVGMKEKEGRREVKVWRDGEERGKVPKCAPCNGLSHPSASPHVQRNMTTGKNGKSSQMDEREQVERTR